MDPTLCATKEEAEASERGFGGGHRPETPPTVRRRITMTPGQGLGVVVLLLVPVMALSQRLGDGMATRETDAGGWMLRVEAPTSARDGNPTRLRVWLSAPPGAAASGAKVELSHAYLEHFDGVEARPPITAATPRAAVLFDERNTDNGLLATVELTPNRAGSARGYVCVVTDSGEHLELAIRTFVFP